MATLYFTIPDTGTIVYDGDLVILSEFPDNRAIAAHGWYVYNQTTELGWHFVILPTNEAVPAADVNLSLLTVVSNFGCNHRPPVPIPCPDDGHGIHQIEDRAFITLDSMAQLKKLPTMFMPNGRIVRVNNRGDGKPGYYEWNVLTQEWDDWDISRVSPGPTPENIAKIEIKTTVNSVDSAEYTDEYTEFIFRTGKPLCDNLGVAEGTLCELRFVDSFQVIKSTESQDLFIRSIHQTSPSWDASEWFASRDRARIGAAESDIANIGADIQLIKYRISAIEEKIESWVQNDRLENVLTGAPRRSNDELNALLEARLNGEEIDITSEESTSEATGGE